MGMCVGFIPASCVRFTSRASRRDDPGQALHTRPANPNRLGNLADRQLLVKPQLQRATDASDGRVRLANGSHGDE